MVKSSIGFGWNEEEVVTSDPDLTPPPKAVQQDVVSKAPFWLVVFGIVVASFSMMIYQQLTAPRSIIIPALNELEQQGAGIFSARCRSCHGENAAGSDNGPTLIHRYYEPGLHGDSTFFDAITHGATGHHWNYGDMPPVENLKNEEIAAIVAYVRKLQSANGIHWQ
jgi:mono/diheme cytochrome c family protein